MVQTRRLFWNIAVILVNTIRHYWLSPTDANSATHACYEQLAVLLKTCDQISVRIINDQLVINGNNVEDDPTTIGPFVNHLISAGIDNFTIHAGVTPDEFQKFITLATSQPDQIKSEGGFVAMLEKNQVKGITSKKMIFREIADEEVVVSKKDMEAAARGGPAADKTGGGNILAFLKGHVDESKEQADETARQIASDPERMAELILQAAEIRQREGDGAIGETLADFVVGCIKRAYKGVRKSDIFQTQKGKKKIAKDLIILEEAILKRMREMTQGAWNEEDLEAISKATEEITDEVKIDAVTDEYMTKVTAIDEVEEKILEEIRKGGVIAESRIQQKLFEKGLSLGGWQELVIKSGPGGTGGPGQGGGSSGGTGGGGADGIGPGHIIDAIEHLDHLLDHMEKQFEETKEPPPQGEGTKMIEILENVSKDIRQLTQGTSTKIAELVESLKTDSPAVTAAEAMAAQAGKPITTTRQGLLEAISRILVEINEPLDLIKTSLDMMNSKVFAGNVEMQTNVLRVMGENAEIIKALIGDLRMISGGGKQAEHTPDHRPCP